MNPLKAEAFALAAILSLPSEFAAELRTLRAKGPIDQKTFVALLTKHLTNDDATSTLIWQSMAPDFLLNAFEGISTSAMCLTASMGRMLGYSGGSCPALAEQHEIFKRLTQTGSSSPSKK